MSPMAEQNFPQQDEQDLSTTDQATAPEVGATGDGHSATPKDQEGPFAQYLADVPETAREWAAGFIKKVEGDTTKRFQEAAEFRKTFEPYAGIDGLTERYPADKLGQYLQLMDMLDGEPSEESKQLARQIAELHGIEFPDEQPPDEHDEFADEDPDKELREQIRQELLAEMDQRFQPYDEARQQAEHLAEVERQSEAITASFDAIDKDRGKPLTNDQRQQVAKLAESFLDSDDPVKAGYEFWTSIVSATEQGLVKAKSQEPAPAEKGGQPGSQVTRPRSIEEAHAALKERLAAERQAA